MSAPSGPSVVVRPLEPGEHAWLLALNNASTPEVNELDEAQLRRLLGFAHVAIIAVVDGVPAGAAVVVGEAQPYWSLNYAWFGARFRDFLYIDRVMVDPPFRSRGVGRALYAAIEVAARAVPVARLVCEVNDEPPNPVSFAFHTTLGFVRVGTHAKTGMVTRCAMLERRLS